MKDDDGYGSHSYASPSYGSGSYGEQSQKKKKKEDTPISNYAPVRVSQQYSEPYTVEDQKKDIERSSKKHQFAHNPLPERTSKEDKTLSQKLEKFKQKKDPDKVFTKSMMNGCGVTDIRKDTGVITDFGEAIGFRLNSDFSMTPTDVTGPTKVSNWFKQTEFSFGTGVEISESDISVAGITGGVSLIDTGVGSGTFGSL